MLPTATQLTPVLIGVASLQEPVRSGRDVSLYGQSSGTRDPNLDIHPLTSLPLAPDHRISLPLYSTICPRARRQRQRRATSCPPVTAPSQNGASGHTNFFFKIFLFLFAPGARFAPRARCVYRLAWTQPSWDSLCPYPDRYVYYYQNLTAVSLTREPVCPPY